MNLVHTFEYFLVELETQPSFHSHLHARSYNFGYPWPLIICMHIFLASSHSSCYCIKHPTIIGNPHGCVALRLRPKSIIIGNNEEFLQHTSMLISIFSASMIIYSFPMVTNSNALIYSCNYLPILNGILTHWFVELLRTSSS